MQFKIPSVDALLQAMSDSLRRFPLVLLCAFAAAVLAVKLTFSPSLYLDDDRQYWLRAFGVLGLGIPLFFAAKLIAESRFRTESIRQGVHAAIGVVILLAVLFSWKLDSTRYFDYRYAQYQLAAHLLVAIAPFFFTKSNNAFWQFNRIIFLRFLLAVVFSGTLYLGIVAAMLGVKALFGVSIQSESYLAVFWVLALIANTWIFLSSVPSDIGALERDRSYPNGLRMFAQYVLLPLVCLYLVIL